MIDFILTYPILLIFIGVIPATVGNTFLYYSGSVYISRRAFVEGSLLGLAPVLGIVYGISVFLDGVYMVIYRDNIYWWEGYD